jgi:serine acetyltransferase
MSDVPAGMTVIGNPARNVWRNTEVAKAPALTLAGAPENQSFLSTL